MVTRYGLNMKPTAVPILLLASIAIVVARVRSCGANQRLESCETGIAAKGPQTAFNIWPVCMNGNATTPKFEDVDLKIIDGRIRISAAKKSTIANTITQ